MTLLALFATPSGSGHELTVDAGPYSLTGAGATLLLARQLVAASGNYVLAGAAATLARALMVPVDPGSHAITGAAATLARDVPLNAGAGTYSLAGSSVALLRALSINAAPGSHSLTGGAATSLRSLIGSSDSGPLTLDGALVTFLAPYQMDAGAEAREIVGAEAELVHGENTTPPVTITASLGGSGPREAKGRAKEPQKRHGLTASPGAYRTLRHPVFFEVVRAPPRAQPRRESAARPLRVTEAAAPNVERKPERAATALRSVPPPCQSAPRREDAAGRVSDKDDDAILVLMMSL